jgi:predicted dehydrogenase
VTFRAAVIGCGKIGSEFADDPRASGVYSHAGAYVSCRATDLVAVCDADAGKLQACVARWGVAAGYRDARMLLSEQRPDIVSVCTPDHTHFDLISAAIDTPGVRAVLAEKPLALERAQAETLVKRARERGVVLAVNYSRRYDAAHVMLKEWLESGGIGDMQRVGGVYTKGTRHNGTHWFDLARWYAGECVRAWGFDLRGENGPDPTLDAVLQFESGAAGHLQACDAAAFSVFEMDLIGTRGRVRILDSGYRLEVQNVVDSPRYTGYRTLVVDKQTESPMSDLVLHAVDDLARCLNEGGRPRCSGEDGVAALAIALAVSESARTGHPVAVHGVRGR